MFKSLVTSLAILATPVMAWDIQDMNDHIEQTNFIIGNHCSGTLISTKHRLVLTNEHCTDKYVTFRNDTVVNSNGIVQEVRKEYKKDVPVSQKVYRDHKLVSQSSYIGDIISYDEALDLSLIQLRQENIPQTRAAKIFSGDSILRGETVYAIGNPHMLDASVTKGIMSNTNRLVRMGNDYRAFYQIDATITGGSSGGSLYNDSGEFIGVPAAGARDSNVGLSIPHTVVKHFLKQNCYEELWNEEAETYEECSEKKKTQQETKGN